MVIDGQESTVDRLEVPSNIEFSWEFLSTSYSLLATSVPILITLK